jgi:hypothetical protein
VDVGQHCKGRTYDGLPVELMFPPHRGNVLMATDNAQQQGPKMTDLIAVQRIAGWEKLKTLVLDSVSSPITKRVYNMALDEFLGWFQQAPRPGFTKATVSAWRVSLEARSLGSSHFGRRWTPRSDFWASGLHADSRTPHQKRHPACFHARGCRQF